MYEAQSSSVNHPPVVDVPIESAQSVVLKRKLTSSVWSDFKKTTDPAGIEHAVCDHCKRKFSGASKFGTTHLRNHVNRCPIRMNKMKGQLELQTTLDSAEDNLVKIKNFKFDNDRSRVDLCRMVIKHHYSFNIVEHDLFGVFVNNLQPKFKMVSRNTLKADILKVYEMEKKLLYKKLEELPSRVSLTTDLWTCSSQNVAYCALTVHYIDNDWVLRKKVLCFPKIESKHDGMSLFAIMKNLLLNWNLEKKFFSMTVDNATSNDVMIRNLKTSLCELNLLPLSGEIFHVRCAAHILNLIVQDGLKSLDGLIKKIRDSIIYVSSSPQRKHQFFHLLTQLKMHKMKLPGDDVPTRWNSTYLMLDSAIAIKAAYARLEQVDCRYTLNPTAGEWAIGESVCSCLKVFYDATLKFSGVKYPTACLYFAIVCGIKKSIISWSEHDDDFICDMSKVMKLKFDKYWNESNLLMCLAVVLDPRFKFAFVEFYLNEIDGIGCEMELSNIRTALKNLFDEYSVTNPSVVSSSASVNNNAPNLIVSSNVDVDCMEDFNNWYSSSHNVSQAQKSELETYLEDPLIRGGDFNRLSWWSDNAARFPTLGRMARDVLAVPISTVASESSFSIGGNIIDPSRSCLGAEVFQALMCGQDWIQVPEKVSRRAAKLSGAPLHP